MVYPTGYLIHDIDWDSKQNIFILKNPKILFSCIFLCVLIIVNKQPEILNITVNGFLKYVHGIVRYLFLSENIVYKWDFFINLNVKSLEDFAIYVNFISKN